MASELIELLEEIRDLQKIQIENQKAAHERNQKNQKKAATLLLLITALAMIIILFPVLRMWLS